MNCPNCGRGNPENSSFCNSCSAKFATLLPLTHATETKLLSKPVSSDFVGREREMGVLEAALEHARAGHGRLVMLVGEPGIGKTRTARELAAIAEQRGVQVLWGRCYEGEGAPPYWPWVQTIRSYVQQKDSEQLRTEMGPGAGTISEIVPELRDKLPGLELPPTLDSPESARFRLFDSITTFLKRVSQNHPIFVMLDDLHWADKSSLLLLEFMSRELSDSSMLIVSTYRDSGLSQQHPFYETLAQLSRVEAFQRVPLGGLSYEDIEHFVEAAYNTQLSQELAEAIYARTEGNPFFMNEVIRLLQDKFQENREGTGFSLDLGIPEGVREVIRHRVGILSEQCNQMLTMASVIGREFDFNQLKAVIVDMSEVQLLDAIDEALVARVMDDAQGTTERYQFSHALIRNAIYEELSSSRRARAHAEVGEALETSYEANVKAHAAELAYHFAEAQNVIGTEKLVRYSLLASEHALDSYAYEEGLIHIERALAAKEGQPDDAEKARLLFALAIAKSATLEYHQLQEVVDAVRAAFELSVEIGEVSQALDIAEFPFATIWGNSGESDLIARALTLVEPDSQRAGRLLARYGRILQLEKNEYENAMEALRHALVIAQCGSDLALERQILGYMAVVEALQLHYRESLDVAQDVIRLAGTSGYDINSDFLGHFLATLASISIGRSGNLRFHLDPMIITADKSQHHFALTTTRYCQGIVSRLEGNLNAACEHYKHGLELGPGDVRLLHDLTIQECELGHFDQTESLLGQLLQTVRQSAIGPNLEHSCIVLTIASTSYISVDISRFDIAEASADIVLSSPFATPVAATLARIGLALIAFQQDDRDSAETLYATLLPNRGIFICQAWGRVDHVLGLLCLTMNKLDDSIVHFEDDLNFCRQAGYRPESAWTAYGYADSLVRRNGSGDHNRAISLLEEALSISSELGMRPLMEKVISLMERAKTRPTKAFAYPDGLTEREVGVLRLIANGMTDREIALELVISHRTVNNHVRSIFNKTAAVNRAEASTYATRQGLV